VATSLLVIALVSSGSVASVLSRGDTLPLAATSVFVAATAAGMLLGRKVSSRLSDAAIQRGFAFLLLVAAAQMMAKAAFA